MASKPYNKGHKPCYYTHPIVEFPGVTGRLFGGNAMAPVHKFAQNYVALELTPRIDKRAYPWAKGESFLFHIQNGHAPDDANDFKRLITWICDCLAFGEDVHVGCIGGHGRTGMVLSAVAASFSLPENINPIEYIRTKYCHKAVETEVQVKFLEKHFGCDPVTPYYVLKKTLPLA